MGACASCEQSPCECGCGDFTVLDEANVQGTLMASLIPCIDSVRDIYSCLGVRAYQVWLVRTQWSGGERGVGQESVLEALQVLPTPKVDGMGGVQRSTHQFGTVDDGSVTVSEVSARYTEAELLGQAVGSGASTPDDQNFYWEVRDVTGQPGEQRRRFTVVGVPDRDMARVEWTVRLQRAGEDRGPFQGEPR